MRRWLLPVVGLALVLGSVGCAPKSVPVGGAPREKNIAKIVSLSPSVTEIAMTNRGTGQLVGRTASCNWPTAMVTSIPIVAEFKPNYEMLAEIKPDLVAYDGDLLNAQDLEKLKQLGAEMFVFKATTVDDFIKELYRFGSVTAAETNVSSYVDRIVAARNQSLADPFPRKIKVAMILPGVGYEHMIAGKNSFQADIIRAAAAEPVGPDSTRFEKLNPEQLLADAPDVIVVGASGVPGQAEKGVNAVKNDPRLSNLPAIKSGKGLIPLNQDVVVRRGSRVDRFIENLHGLIAGATK